jgi:hypothetical protein
MLLGIGCKFVGGRNKTEKAIIKKKINKSMIAIKLAGFFAQATRISWRSSIRASLSCLSLSSSSRFFSSFVPLTLIFFFHQ